MRTYIIALAFLSISAGCGGPDEPPWSHECPEGEVCSPNEARGLYFVGSSLSDDWFELSPGIQVVAAGGSQTIQVLDADQHPLAYGFEAALQGGPFTMAEVAPPDVTLASSTRGSTFLRIIDPANGLLLDKVEVEARPVAKVEAGPLPVELPAETAASWALLGGSGLAYVTLRDGGEARLVDERLTLAVVDDGATQGAQVAWDAIALTRAAAGTAQVAVTTGDGRLRTVEVTFVDHVEAVTFETDLGAYAAVGESGVYCFAARAGEAQVYGAEWSFVVTGPLGSPEPLLPNCATVYGQAAGPATITATAAGVSTTLAVEVVLPGAATPKRIFRGHGGAVQPGLRAAAALPRVAGR